MKYPRFVSSSLLSLLAIVFAILGVCRSSLAAKPNVVVVLTDDQGWGDLSIHGNKNLSTPNIDRLAREGAAFERFYVCPVCSPTRAEFLTGRCHPRSGVYSTSAGGERMDIDETTIADTFRDAGYTTAAFGKWHNGMQYPYHPNGRGFDEYYGFCSGHWGDYFSPPLEHNGKPVQGKGFLIDDFTSHAIQFMEENREQPFFIYLPYNTPHSPMQVPQRWWDKFEDAELGMRHREPKKERVQHTRAALAMCENIDWNVGRLMDKLDQLKIAENTIFVYFCDNGPNGSRWNGGMRGRKGSTDEGGVRSPLFVRYPDAIKAGTHVKQISSVTDLLPTLADLSKIPLTTKKKLDGVSVASWLTEPKTPVDPKRVIVSHWRNRLSARTQRFRLDMKGQLYDMIADPGQATDVSEKHPDVTSQLKKAVQSYRDDVLTEMDVTTKRRFVLGHPGAEYTQIPARDASVTGSIKRSNRFPNCSFYSNWVNPDDTIRWEVDVPADGKFEVELHYTVAKEDVGATLSLELGESSVEAKIETAHDPPLRGGENDRVQRTESYVKDFTKMTMGEIHLKKGQGTLVLRAKDIPGKMACDFRLLMFRRIQ